MDEMLRHTTEEHFRYIYDKIDWRARLIAITGPRGVGKSTMLLQHIKKHREDQHNLYVSADNLYFANHRIVELADEFVKEGGTHLYIDEIHKYSGWSREIKQTYDVHPALHIVFTGSSVLDIQKGQSDLSRRAVTYHLQGLSFREYLLLFHDIHSKSFSLEDILSHKVFIDKLPHPLPLFRSILRLVTTLSRWNRDLISA